MNMSSSKTSRIGRHWRRIRRSPAIVLVPALLFSSLVAAGITLVHIFATRAVNNATDEVYDLGIAFGNWFAGELASATLPLFSLAQFVAELDIFRDMAAEIGPGGEEGSLPYLLQSNIRDVTEVCSQSGLTSRFSGIVKTMEANSGTENVLINTALAPHGVVCLVHSDEDETQYFQVGEDLTVDPRYEDFARQALSNPDGQISMAGPIFRCNECTDPSFLVMLPVRVRDYGTWGFSMAWISWNEMVERSGMMSTFASNDLEVRMIQNDHSGKEVVLVESEDFEDQKNTVFIPISTANQHWELEVGYDSYIPRWQPWAFAGVIMGSLLLTSLVYIVLVQSYVQTDLVEERSALLIKAAKDSAQAERDLNDFIAHEVRNPLSAAILASSFVSSEVNKQTPMPDLEAQASVREDMKIVNSSLQFINELLRNMLDIHRAANQQLTMEMVETDLLRDVFEPVRAMLYTRDDNFNVIIECPANLVIETDRLRLKQVILNLARNSTKFVVKGFVRLRAQVIENEVHIFVEDSGPGIPGEKRKALFNRFQESLDLASQGTGVGLNLCKNLVDLMGGEIALDDTYNSGMIDCPGACFDINMRTPAVESSDDDSFEAHALLLPSETTSKNERAESGITQDTFSETHSACTHEGSDFSEDDQLPAECSVLFVDDDRILRRLASRSLTKHLPNWKISEAASGESALEITKDTSFDLIFMDQYMTSAEHSLKGTETVREMRARGIASFICGLSANDLQETFLNAGADSFCLKPFPCKEIELKQMLVQVFKARGPESIV